MGASDFLELNLLNRNLTDPVTALADPSFIGLASAAPLTSDTGTTLTEVAYTSYARVSTTGTDWNAAVSGAKDNVNAITFPQCTGGTDTATHWFRASAASAGDLYEYGMLCTAGSVVNAMALATGDIFHSEAHGFNNDDRVSLIDLLDDFPTGPSRDQTGGYFIISSTTDTFQISTSSAGAAVTITSNGFCQVGIVAHLAISNLVTPSFAAGALIIRAA